jgi:uncharacterized protein
MGKKRATPVGYRQPYRLASPNIPLAAIRRFARQIAERFHPDRIILFGSYAYGQPHAESDVDLLVIMSAYDVIAQAVRISGAFERRFSHSIIVRTPQQIERGLREDDCDWFLREVMDKGKVLYEAPHRAVGCQGRGGHRISKSVGRTRKAQAKRGVLPLSASRGEIPQGPAPGKRTTRAKDP